MSQLDVEATERSPGDRRPPRRQPRRRAPPPPGAGGRQRHDGAVQPPRSRRLRPMVVRRHDHDRARCSTPASRPGSPPCARNSRKQHCRPAAGRSDAQRRRLVAGRAGPPAIASAPRTGCATPISPRAAALAIEADGALALYDTGDHDIGGVSQQQGGGRSLRFTGRSGPVDLDQPDAPRREPTRRGPPLRARAVPPGPAAEASPGQRRAGGRQRRPRRRSSARRDRAARACLTEGEFTAKKAELLGAL